MKRRTKLVDKIIILFITSDYWQLTTWELANAIYGGIMNTKNKSNGAIIANICKAAVKSKSLKLDGGIVHFTDKKPEN